MVGPVLRPCGNAADFEAEGWSFERVGAGARVSGVVRVVNRAGDREVMLTSVEPKVVLLSDGALDAVEVTTMVRSLEASYPPRVDGYWTAYVVKPHGDSRFEVTIDVGGKGVDDVYAVWVDVVVGTYGASGREARHVHEVLSLSVPERPGGPPATPPAWRVAANGARVLAVGTHLLTPHDDPASVVARYAESLAEPGDIVTMGESPLAVMQGRFRHPGDIAPGWVARRLCYMLSGQGSLGTAPGLQALIDEVGTARVLRALAVGSLGKALERDGDFYRSAGEAAKLIDDVTGTLPPYDQFVVLGPQRCDEVVAAITARSGLGAAIVDANDLGKVDVLAASSGVDRSLVVEALRSNPAGNGMERTPLVLIRPPG